MGYVLSENIHSAQNKIECITHQFHLSVYVTSLMKEKIVKWGIRQFVKEIFMPRKFP